MNQLLMEPGFKPRPRITAQGSQPLEKVSLFKVTSSFMMEGEGITSLSEKVLKSRFRYFQLSLLHMC